MTDDVQHRLSTEGADPLLLAGVNDANLLELGRATGVRATMRGDTLTLYSIDFATRDIGWAVGPRGRIVMFKGSTP